MCLFFLSPCSKIKCTYGFPTLSTSQIFKVNYNLCKTHKSTTSNHNIKCKPPSMVLANSYKAELEGIIMLEVGRCCQKIKDKWHCFLSMHIWHGIAWGLCVGIYKGVEVQKMKMMNLNAKSFVCVCEGGKIWNIEPKETKNLYFFN